jgi:hypothetical protein
LFDVVCWFFDALFANVDYFVANQCGWCDGTCIDTTTSLCGVPLEQCVFATLPTDPDTTTTTTIETQPSDATSDVTQKIVVQTSRYSFKKNVVFSLGNITNCS